jgi:hypothetical protein
MMKLDEALTGVKNWGLDTAPVIYFVEKHLNYDALVTEIFHKQLQRVTELRVLILDELEL